MTADPLHRPRSTGASPVRAPFPLTRPPVSRPHWPLSPVDAGPPQERLLSVNGRTLEGNCDLCFLKPQRQRLALIKARPESAEWWIRMESLNLANKPSGARFRADGPTYAELTRFAASQGDLFDPSDEPISCYCGD